jgi:N-acetylglucosaminyldiphosphoundecaprenol N-acetyl-beta-D-mannosaminyltransferase
MQRAGLTWFYRFIQEPTRLWRRYLLYNSLFIFRLGKQILAKGFNGCQTLVEVPDRSPKGDFNSFDPTVRDPDATDGQISGMPARSNVLGVGISVVDLEQASRIVLKGALEVGAGKYVTVTGVHGVMESQRNPELKKIHNSSFLSTPDGMPMAWMGKWNGYPEIDRVYGPDLMLKVTDKSAELGLKHFYFGGKEGVADKLAERFQGWFPGIETAGTMSPPFRFLNADEEDAFIARLNRVQPHFLWVGLSSPGPHLVGGAALSRLPAGPL